MDIGAFLQRCWDSDDFDRLSQAAWLPLCDSKGRKNPLLDCTSPETINSAVLIDTPDQDHKYCPLVSEHMKALVHLRRGNNPGAVYNSTSSTLSHLIAASSDKKLDTRSVRLIKRLSTNLLYAALVADSENINHDDTISKSQMPNQINWQNNHLESSTLDDNNKTEKSKKTEEAARLLAKIFTFTLSDRSPLGRRGATIAVCNLLYRIYCSLGTVRLCTNIARALLTNGSDIDLEKLPASDICTQKYYLARIAINSGAFGDAQEELQTALHCLAPFYKDCPQRVRILVYLIIVKAIRGLLPTSHALREWGLFDKFGDLVYAIRRGDLRLFDIALMRNQAFYMRVQIFLLIQLHLRNLILRSFVKKV